jgi:hypothetical protein
MAGFGHSLPQTQTEHTQDLLCTLRCALGTGSNGRADCICCTRNLRAVRGRCQPLRRAVQRCTADTHYAAHAASS